MVRFDGTGLENDGNRATDDNSDGVLKVGYDGNAGVPRVESTSKVDTFETGDRGEVVVCPSPVASDVPCGRLVLFLRFCKLPDLDLAIDVIEAGRELDPNMSLTEKEWRGLYFFFDRCGVAVTLLSWSSCFSLMSAM